MAYQGNSILHAMPANADLSASQWCAVLLNSSGKIAVAGAAAVSVFGVLENQPAAAGRDASICLMGVTKGKAGAAITVGAALETDSTGRFITATTGHNIVAYALASASGANSLIPVLVKAGGLVP